MDVTKKINVPDWIDTEQTRQLMKIMGGDVHEAQSLFVGGCVRNAVMDFGVTDIDIATKYTPQQVTQKLESQNIKVVPTGIDHGTVTAVVDGIPFEVTTLRKDVETDGRRASVAFTNDWKQDAARRDFTINTLLMDMEGNVYDPTETGLADLEARQVVFVGNPAERIAEDYLRILRFFRFQAQYGQGEMDAKALQACSAATDKVSELSKERITQEFTKIIAVRDPTDILKTMFDNNVLIDVFDKNYLSDTLHKLCYFQDEFLAHNIVSRLFVLAGMKPRLFDGVLLLTHAQKKFIIKLEMATRAVLYKNEKSLKKEIFYHGNELLIQGYLLMLAQSGEGVDVDMLAILQNWQAPECPITGQTLLDEGYQTGPELGQELTRLQEEWLDRVT